jgi:hypothetical protein
MDRIRWTISPEYAAYAQFRLKPVKHIWEEWVRIRVVAFPELDPTHEITHELNFRRKPHNENLLLRLELQD